MSLQAVSSAITAARGGLDLLSYIRGIGGSDVVSAFYRFDGTKISGSDKVKVNLHYHPDHKTTVWWYEVENREDYVFVRQPVVESCVLEEPARIGSEPLSDARYWRWIAPIFPGLVYSVTGCPNIKVDFLIYGYRVNALLKHFGGGT